MIITRGFGDNQMIITKGYGTSKIMREILRLTSTINPILKMVSKYDF